jgi:hypothetical protein
MDRLNIDADETTVTYSSTNPTRVSIGERVSITFHGDIQFGLSSPIRVGSGLKAEAGLDGDDLFSTADRVKSS